MRSYKPEELAKRKDHVFIVSHVVSPVSNPVSNSPFLGRDRACRAVINREERQCLSHNGRVNTRQTQFLSHEGSGTTLQTGSGNTSKRQCPPDPLRITSNRSQAAPQPMPQLWTAHQKNGPNHLGALVQCAARAPAQARRVPGQGRDALAALPRRGRERAHPPPHVTHMHTHVRTHTHTVPARQVADLHYGAGRQ